MSTNAQKEQTTAMPTRDAQILTELLFVSVIQGSQEMVFCAQVVQIAVLLYEVITVRLTKAGKR